MMVLVVHLALPEVSVAIADTMPNTAGVNNATLWKRCSIGQSSPLASHADQIQEVVLPRAMRELRDTLDCRSLCPDDHKPGPLEAFTGRELW